MAAVNTNMASLLKDPLFEISGRGPAPNKDFYYFAVTKSQVIWRWWKISARTVDRYTKPGEEKESHSVFLDDFELQREVGMVFGAKILQFTKALCQGQYNYLERLPDSILLQIINCLELEDVGQLGRTSRRFRQLCGSQEFWEQATRQRCCTISAEVASLALEVGWRRIFFTNKLQLQKLLGRRRPKAEQGGRPDCDEDAKAEGSASEGSGSEEEIPAGTVCLQGAGADPDFNANPCRDVGPDPEADYDPFKLIADRLREDIRFSEVETLAQNRKLGRGVGDSTEPI
ncbi:F-box only protein 36b [Fundulus heteroclitus]|uniref:F-box only protein 36b n=1 Tax=Fundulus heteroclitus TaxID=8078 RepID=UPI00165AFE8B|nr:F-box only protein 36b [Fundulus heteroclitus]